MPVSRRKEIAVVVFLWIFLVCGMFFGGLFLFGGGEDTHSGDDIDAHDLAPDGETSEEHHDGPAIFSIKNFFLFGTSFGGVGYIVSAFGGTEIVATISGLGSGIVTVWFITIIYRFLFNQQASTTSNLSKLLGKIAQVTICIPEDGLGEIQVSNEFGTTVTITAISSKGEIGVGRRVLIDGIVGGKLSVREK